jgi:hypothetical protein
MKKKKEIEQNNGITKTSLNDSIYYLSYKASNHSLYLYYNINGELIQLEKEDSLNNIELLISFSNNKLNFLTEYVGNNQGVKYEYENGITKHIVEYKDYENATVNQSYSLSSSIENKESFYYKIDKINKNSYNIRFNDFQEYDELFFVVGLVDEQRMNIRKAFIDTVWIKGNGGIFTYEKQTFEGLLFLRNYSEEGTWTKSIYVKYPKCNDDILINAI